MRVAADIALTLAERHLLDGDALRNTGKGGRTATVVAPSHGGCLRARAGCASRSAINTTCSIACTRVFVVVVAMAAKVEGALLRQAVDLDLRSAEASAMSVCNNFANLLL